MAQREPSKSVPQVSRNGIPISFLGTAIPTNRFSLLGPDCMSVRMKRDFLFFTVFLLLFTPPAFGRMPELNVKAICKAGSADAKILRSVPEQSVADCVRDEEDKKQQLTTLWASSSFRIRNRCQSDGRSLGTTSYLDLLSCIQLAEDVKSDPKKVKAK
jgi:hypothetical protein